MASGFLPRFFVLFFLLLSRCFAAQVLLPSKLLAFSFYSRGFGFGSMLSAGGALLFLPDYFALLFGQLFCLPQFFCVLFFLFECSFLLGLFDLLLGYFCGIVGYWFLNSLGGYDARLGV
jgi:hypothetical protein